MDLALKLLGDECLTKKSDTIDDIDEYISSLVAAMIVKMGECEGIGLAAPQVGHNIRLLVMRLNTNKITEMINPRISWCSDERVNMQEGCLSIPGKSIWIERPAKVRVKFQTLDGDFKYWCLHKMNARVFLHEYDHLEGILMTEKL